MIDAPLALAFTAGLVATVNPCGFAMLPAYLSYFVGLENMEAADSHTSVARALAVGGVVSTGFLVVFAAAGALMTAGVRSFIDYVPWVAIVIGVALAGLGVAMLRGFHLTMAVPGIERGGGSRRARSVFVFGVSYAVASLSCTLPVFLAVVASTFTRTDFVSGFATFLAYGLGMSLVILVLTLALALAKQSLVRNLRRAVRYVDRVAGALLVVAGAYIVYYWAFSLSTEPGTTAGSGPARFVERLSSEATVFINDLGATPALLALGGVVVAAALYALSRSWVSRDGGWDPDAASRSQASAGAERAERH